jgi:hypothetical protein
MRQSFKQHHLGNCDQGAAETARGSGGSAEAAGRLKIRFAAAAFIPRSVLRSPQTPSARDTLVTL